MRAPHLRSRKFALLPPQPPERSQNIHRISSGCQTALAGILSNSDAACLNPSGLLGVISAGSDTSLVSPLDKWAQGMCGQAACTNSSLSSVVNALLPACSTELSSVTGSEVSAADATTLVQTYYPPLRDAICLQE